MDQDVDMKDDPDSGSHTAKQPSTSLAPDPYPSAAHQASHMNLGHLTPQSSSSEIVPSFINLSEVQLNPAPGTFPLPSDQTVIARDFATGIPPHSRPPDQTNPTQPQSQNHKASSQSVDPNSRLSTPVSDADTDRFSQTPEFHHSFGQPRSRNFERSESPTPPASRDKGKWKAYVEDADEVDRPDTLESNQEHHEEEKEGSTPPTKRRRPRPKPVFGDNDPNLLFTGHMEHPPEHPLITPTSATGFAGLNLGGNNQAMDHDMTDEMAGVPANLGKSVLEYVMSQLRGDSRNISSGPPTSSSVDSKPGSQQLNMPQKVDTGIAPTRPKLEPSRPSKKIKKNLTFASDAVNSKGDSSQHQQSKYPHQSTQQGYELYPGCLVPSIEVPMMTAGQYSRQPENPRKRKFAPFKDLSYRRTNNPNFNVFSDGILRQPDLLFHFASALSVKNLINLYAISRDFHRAMNHRFATMILSTAYIKAPESARIFPFRGYLPLAIDDPRHQFPSERIPHPDPKKAALGIPRKVPGFKWLQMILYREKIVQEIMAIMAEDGIPLPSQMSAILKHIWFAMDLPDSGRRVGYFHMTHIVTDLDLFYGIMFIVRLDMRLTNPATNYPVNVGAQLRRVILGQRSLSYVWKVLKGLKLRNEFDILREWVKFKYNPTRIPAERHLSVFGVPSHRLGRGCLINWGKPVMTKEGRWVLPAPVEGNILVRPDQILNRECIRRRLGMSRWHKKMMMWGYADMEKLRAHQFDPEEVIASEDPPMNFDPEPRAVPRRVPGLEDDYSDNEEVGAPEIPSEEKDRDPLLDLGPVKQKSVFVIQPDRRHLEAAERERRVKEAEVLKRMMDIFKSQNPETMSTSIDGHQVPSSQTEDNSKPLYFLPNFLNDADANVDIEMSLTDPPPPPPPPPPKAHSPSPTPPPSPSVAASTLLDLSTKWPVLHSHPEIWIDATNESELWVHITKQQAEEEKQRQMQQQRELAEKLEKQKQEEHETLRYFGLTEEDLLVGTSNAGSTVALTDVADVGHAGPAPPFLPPIPNTDPLDLAFSNPQHPQSPAPPPPPHPTETSGDDQSHHDPPGSSAP